MNTPIPQCCTSARDNTGVPCLSLGGALARVAGRGCSPIERPQAHPAWADISSAHLNRGSPQFSLYHSQPPVVKCSGRNILAHRRGPSALGGSPSRKVPNEVWEYPAQFRTSLRRLLCATG